MRLIHAALLLAVPFGSSESMSFTHAYDSLGNLSSTRYPGNYLASYSPNALGQPTQVAGFVSGVQYHPNGAVKQYTYANGIVRNNTHNTRGLLSQSRDAYGATAFHDFQYAFDANGNIALITDAGQAGLQNRSMTYDGLDRLLTTDAPSIWGLARYVYDPLDNLREADVGARQYRYIYSTATWRLTQINTPSGALFTVGQDARGNVTSRGAARVYTFDRANRMTGIASLGDSYYYDGNDRRIGIIGPSGARYTLYTQDGLLRGGPDSTPSVAARRWHMYLGKQPVGIRNEPISGAAATHTYLHTDALGSPVVETNASRGVVNRTNYEPYGVPQNRTVEGIGYTGHHMDSDSGLTYMQARYYDPALGRFLSVDPVGVDPTNGANFNRYWYANNNPYTFTDPDGRQSTEVGCDDICEYEQTRAQQLGTTKRAADVASTAGDVLEAASPLGVTGKLKLSSIVLVKLASRAKLAVTFGRNANATSHAFRHVVKQGMDPAKVQKAILADLKSTAAKIPEGKHLNQTIAVGDKKVTYTAYKLVNVGRITIPDNK